MSIGIILAALLIVSVLTGLTVEAIKALAKETVKSNNILAGIVSVVLSVALVAIYCIWTKTTCNSTIILEGIIITFGSWLCAMLGYDKVSQTILQLKDKVKDILDNDKTNKE